MSDHADTIRRAERVGAWANMHGDYLAGALRLDTEDDAPTIDAITEALRLVEDVYAQVIDERDRLAALIDGEGPQISMGTAAGILGKEVEARKAAEARCEQAIDALREADKAATHYAKMHAYGAGLAKVVEITGAALVSLGEKPAGEKP